MREGDIAPPFDLPTQRGVRTRLADALARGPALIAFPGRTSGTAAHERLRALAAAWPRLRASHVELLVVVPDPLAQAKRYVEENGTPFHLLCDIDGAVAASYGVRRRFTLRNDTQPALVGVDRGGIIRRRRPGTWDDRSVVEALP